MQQALVKHRRSPPRPSYSFLSIAFSSSVNQFSHLSWGDLAMNTQNVTACPACPFMREKGRKSILAVCQHQNTRMHVKDATMTKYLEFSLLKGLNVSLYKWFLASSSRFDSRLLCFIGHSKDRAVGQVCWQYKKSPRYSQVFCYKLPPGQGLQCQWY